jgi:MFS family permease
VWPKKIQGLILSAYFYGYLLTQLLGGWLSFKFGGQIILALSMLIGSLITISIPFFAKLNYKALFACLFFTGAAHGAFWPSVSSFWAYWAPSVERGRLVGISSSGSRIGNVVALSLGGYLCVNGFGGGWPSIFYYFGIMGVCWFFIFIALTSNTPSNHKFISANEKEFILKETKKAIETRLICQSRVPWKAILSSKACWSIFIGV